MSGAFYPPSDVPSEVANVFANWPAPAQGRMLALRRLIQDAAEAVGATPLKETLKWGEPAFVPPKRMGTTIRLNVKEENCAMFVSCQTDLVDRWRAQFPEVAQYDGARAAIMPATGPIAEAAVQQMAGMALTYHRDKRASKR